MSEQRWIDCSFVGSEYEQQVSDRGVYRHRRRELIIEKRRPFDLAFDSGKPWTVGMAPDFPDRTREDDSIPPTRG